MRGSSTGLLCAVVAASCLAAGCGVEATTLDSVESTEQAIRGGDVDPGDLAVGLLFSHSGMRVNESCSGSLIAPNVILTAGHCFDTSVMDAFYVGQGVAVAGGDMDWEKATVNMRRFTIDKWVRPPQYRRGSGIPPSVLDVAVGHLSQPITDVMPLPLASAPPPEGSMGTIIGYGRHPTTGNQYEQHVKRTAEVVISQVLSTTLHQQSVTTGVPLGGDSGGPFLYDGAIAGTVCCGNGPALAQTEQYYARVDLARDWIVGKISDYGGGDGGVVTGTGGTAGSMGGGTAGAGGMGTGGGQGGEAGSGTTGTTTGGAGAGGDSSSTTTTSGSSGGPAGGGVSTPDDKGCGCGIAGSTHRSRALIPTMLALTLLGRRRRRASTPPGSSTSGSRCSVRFQPPKASS